MKRSFFSMVSRIGPCVGLKLCLQVNGIMRFGGLNLFSFVGGYCV
jgi:hypothetical protein